MRSKHVLNTGQRLCYDIEGREIACVGTGQDAELRPGVPWPEPRFRRDGDVVHDRLTGLDWPVRPGLLEWPVPWEEAFDSIDRLNRERFGGDDDWRLPNRRELRSLISYQTRDPALPDGHPFGDPFLTWYWTSTTAGRNPGYAWYVHLEGGRSFFGRKSEDHMVWPCRGRSTVIPATGQRASSGADGEPASGIEDDGCLQRGVRWPNPRFQAGDDAVLDRLTGLVWTRRADVADGLTTCDEAYRAVEALHIAGRPWRLPTLNELESLVDASACDPSLPADHPFTDVRDAYWSSTSSAYEPDWSMALYLASGAVGVGQKKGRSFSVWAVARDRT